MEEARGDVSSGPVALTTERGEFELNTPTGLVSVMMSLPLITHTCGDTWLVGPFTQDSKIVPSKRRY